MRAILPRFFTAFVLGVTFPVATSASVLQYYPDSPAYIGGNFDPSNLTQAYAPCLKPSGYHSLDWYQDSSAAGGVVSAKTPTAISTNFFIKSIRSRKDLYDVLNVSASVSGSYGFFSGSAAFGLEKETNYEEDTFSWVIYGYSNYGRFVLDNIELNETANTVSTNPIAFRTRCGTDYVQEEIRAVEAAAVFKIHNLTQAQKSVLTASLSARFNSGLFSAGGSANYQHFLQTAAQYGEIEVSFYAFGGPGITALAPIATHYDDQAIVLGTFQNYFANLTVQHSVPVSYVTASVQSLAGRPDIMTDYYSKYIGDLYLVYEELGAERDRLKNLLRNASDFSLDDSKQTQVSAEISNISAIMGKIYTSASKCRNAYMDFSRAAAARQSACSGAIPGEAYAPKFQGLSAKPYKLASWTANALTPGDEVIMFDIVGTQIASIQIAKQVNTATPVAVNNVQISDTNGSQHASNAIIMSGFVATDLPIGLIITMKSGRSYVEPFVYTPAPAVGPTPPTPAVGATNPLMTKILNVPRSLADSPFLKTPTADMVRAVNSGALVPTEFKEK